MKPAELFRRLRRLAGRRGLDFEVSQGRNHVKVTLGSALCRHATDLKTGTLNGILKQLGLTPEDIEE